MDNQNVKMITDSLLSTADPLPDILAHSPAVVRRNRSVSVNLPVSGEVTCQRIGRDLRRLSEHFESFVYTRNNNYIFQRRSTMDNSYYRRPS